MVKDVFSIELRKASQQGGMAIPLVIPRGAALGRILAGLSNTTKASPYGKHCARMTTR